MRTKHKALEGRIGRRARIAELTPCPKCDRAGLHAPGCPARTQSARTKVGAADPGT